LSVDPVARAPRRYRSLGLCFALHCPPGSAVELILTDLYSACEQDGAGPVDLDLIVDVDEAAACYELRSGHELLCRTSGVDELIECFAWEVNRSAVERSRHEALVLHAAAVADGPRAVVLVGASGAGKSTLAAALTLAGLTYLGEESVAVTPAGCIVANPKPLALDPGSLAALHSYAPAVEVLGADRPLVAPTAIGAPGANDQPAEPVLIVRPAFRAACKTRATPMAASDAAVLLADQSFNFVSLGADALKTVARIARRAPAFTLEFGDLAAAVAEVRGLLADAGRDAPYSSSSPAPRPGRACEFDGTVEGFGDELVIWDPAHEALHHLSASASAIWTAACRGDTNVEIVDMLARETGRARAGLASEVEHCLFDLRARGLLR
jgi:hypothetical protein